MKHDLPIGKSESQELEFKSRESLQRPVKIAREVAAMLNSGKGGRVWIGIVEEDEVAVGIEPIEEAPKERRRVEDGLVELIEPPPDREVVSVDIVEIDAGKLLVVVVHPSPRPAPYALLQNGGRVYAKRFGARIRPLTREEIRDAFLATEEPTGGEDALEKARSRAHDRRRVIINTILVQIIPAKNQHLDLSKEQRELLADPERTGSRAGGWTYGHEFSRFSPGHDEWKLEFKTSRGTVTTTIRSDGSVESMAGIDFVDFEEKRELYPFALVEYPTSVLRLFRTMHRARDETAAAGPCFVGLSLHGLRGWKLRPRSPDAAVYRELPGHPHLTYEESDVLSVDLASVDWEDLMSDDDRVALRLVRGVYRTFGYEDDPLPREFDQESMKLRL